MMHMMARTWRKKNVLPPILSKIKGVRPIKSADVFHHGA